MCWSPNICIIYGKILLVFSTFLILLPYTNQDDASGQCGAHCYAFSDDNLAPYNPSSLFDDREDQHHRVRRDLSNNKSDEYEFWRIYTRFHGVQQRFYAELARREKNVYWKRIFKGSHWKGPLHLQYFEILRRTNDWFNQYENITNSMLPFDIEDLETVHVKAKAVVDLRQRNLPHYPSNSTEEYRHRKVVVLWNQIVRTVKKLLDRQKSFMQGIVLE